MTLRLANLRPSLLLIAAAAAATPASAQYYGPGYGYGPPGYGPPPVYRPYNAPPPVGREYGRDYEDDGYPPPRAPRPLSSRAVVDRLEDAGYENIGRPRFTGTLYVVHATGPGGVRQELTIDAIRGIILNRVIVSVPSLDGGDEPVSRPRRYGGRELDTDDLYREREEAAPRRPTRRREAARPDAGRPVESEPSAPGDGSDADPLPTPADPRLAPSAEPAPRAAPRPFEGQSGPKREARTDPKRDTAPRETGSRPFGVNPVPPPEPKKEPEGKGATKPAPQKKPVAEVREKPDRPVRVIQGVTPLNNGESRSQIDDLPKPPEPAAPTGQ